MKSTLVPCMSIKRGVTAAVATERSGASFGRIKMEVFIITLINHRNGGALEYNYKKSVLIMRNDQSK